MALDPQVVGVCGLVSGFHWPTLSGPFQDNMPISLFCDGSKLFLKVQSLLLQRIAASLSESSESK